MIKYKGTYQPGDQDYLVAFGTQRDFLNNEAESLDLRLDLMNASPTGFCWGYNGAGPAQLALALTAQTLSTAGLEPKTADEIGLMTYYLILPWVATRDMQDGWEISHADLFGRWVQGLLTSADHIRRAYEELPLPKPKRRRHDRYTH